MRQVMNRGPFPSRPRLKRPCGAIRAALALALVAGASQPALAGPTDSGAAAAVAEVAVMQPLQLVKMKDMDFGRVGAATTAGTIVLDPATGACTASANLLHLGPCRAAQFGGMGARNMLVRINGVSTIQLTGPGQAMVLDTFRINTGPDLTVATGGGNGNGNAYGWSNAPGQSNRRFRIVPTSGIFDFTVGGTLRVNANQAPGVYTGTFSVTVIYQ